ncbi:MAG: nucleoside recognition domain-containing protein [bacterium]
MTLNYIWIAFFLISFIVGLVKLIFLNDTEVFTKMVTSTFTMAETSVSIAIYLIGVMTLWLGIMKVGEAGGAIKLLSKIISPLFNKLFPEVPKDHPAGGSMLMNFAANMLGLDNAATPLGLKAMTELQEINPEKDTASNAQIMFLVLNTSGLTLIPISILAIRAAQGASNPADVFIPILLATYFSTLAGLIAVSLYQKINLWNKTVLVYIGGATLFIAGIIYIFSRLPQETTSTVSATVGNFILFAIIVAFISLALRKKINVYDTFIDGAKEGFDVAVKIIPFLVAMLVAIGVFRASGAMDLLVSGIGWGFAKLGINTDFVAALPTALMKPLSGSGARGMMIEAMETYGADSFAGRLASTFQGSTETTFYTLAVYYGAVSIRKTRYTVTCGLIADFSGIVAAILIAYLFFG